MRAYLLETWQTSNSIYPIIIRLPAYYYSNQFLGYLSTQYVAPLFLLRDAVLKRRSWQAGASNGSHLRVLTHQSNRHTERRRSGSLFCTRSVTIRRCLPNIFCVTTHSLFLPLKSYEMAIIDCNISVSTVQHQSLSPPQAKTLAGRDVQNSVISKTLTPRTLYGRHVSGPDDSVVGMGRCGRTWARPGLGRWVVPTGEEVAPGGSTF